MALTTENSSSPCRGVCHEELQGMYVSWQPQQGRVIEKLTKIQFSARRPTSAFADSGTDLSHPPPSGRQSTMVTGTYIKQHLPTLHNHKCKRPTQSAPDKGRKEVICSDRHQHVRDFSALSSGMNSVILSPTVPQTFESINWNWQGL
jgi:hypothetical protein